MVLWYLHHQIDQRKDGTCHYMRKEEKNMLKHTIFQVNSALTESSC